MVLSERDTGAVRYSGHEYLLLPSTKSWQWSQHDCQAAHNASLATFETLDEFYTVTKALFISDDGVLPRQLRQAAWVGMQQTTDLDLHWVGMNPLNWTL